MVDDLWIQILVKSIEIPDVGYHPEINGLIPSIKEETMKKPACISERMFKYTAAGLLGAAALALTIISVTLLPVVGLVLVIPVAALAVYVFRLHLNDQCEIDPT